MSNRTNPYAPDEDEATILLERNFIAGDLIVGMGYGEFLDTLRFPTSLR